VEKLRKQTDTNGTLLIFFRYDLSIEGAVLEVEDDGILVDSRVYIGVMVLFEALVLLEVL
jgi:hypothetical protein